MRVMWKFELWQKIRLVITAIKRALYFPIAFSKLDDLLIFLQVSAARFSLTEKAVRKSGWWKIVIERSRYWSSLLTTGRQKFFRKGFDQSFLRCTMDPINTAGEPFFLSIQKIFYTRTECQQKLHLLATMSEANFLTKKIFSELQR